MKVIVNFNDVRVIVPCLDLDMRVKDLINEAASRYKKATGKPQNSWVVIHNLKTCIDGAILDPDDRLTDVADDREQITALFEEGNCSSDGVCLQNENHQDGTSLASDSLGTESPDTFSAQNLPPPPPLEVDDSNAPLGVSPTDVDVVVNSDGASPCNDVEITEDEINTCVPVPLQVRRGSEPVLNRHSPVLNDPIDLSKRWSTAVALDNKCTRKLSADSLQGDSILDHSDDDSKSPVFVTNSASPKSVKEEGYGSEEKSETTPSSATSSNTFSRFSRGSGRLSMLNNNIDVWVEAADRQMTKLKNTQGSVDRRANDSNNDDYLNEQTDNCKRIDNDAVADIKDEPVIIKLKSESGPLGIHVVPFCDENGQENSLVIQGIEKDGRVDRDGRLKVGDMIVEINGKSLLDVKFQEAQEIFKQALSTPEIILKVHKAQKKAESIPPLLPPPSVSKRPPPPPVLPKPEPRCDTELGLVEGEEKEGHLTKVATLTPTKKLTSGYPPNNVKTPLTTLTANTRRIGRKYHIRLTKGHDGLGFSITTRDNPAGGYCPIYIKTILPKGAAIQDARLKPGDRLLEVNGIEMSNKSHMEAVSVLRNVPLGCSVDLIVSRQEIDPLPSPKLPRQLPPENSGDASSGEQREVLLFEIPLNDTGSAGLGVSVKGKTRGTTGDGNVDLGIFVKSVIHGGAASKDGRLQPNDQLISINGIPLLGLTNGQAMETLRRAMIQCEGPNAITLTIARRVASNSKDICHQRNGSTLSTDSCSEEHLLPSSCKVLNNTSTDETQSSFKSSNATVIYNSNSHTTSTDTDAAFHHKHPIVDRLTGNETSSNLKLNDDTVRRASKSPTRNDVLIEGDLEDSSCYLKTSVNSSTVSCGEVNSRAVKSVPEEDDPGFTRDGFGRQSISEKRHAQLDAKNTDTYRRNKKAKEEKDRQGPSLQEADTSTPVQEIDVRSALQPHSEDVEMIRRAIRRKIETPKSAMFSPSCCWSCQSPGSCPYHAGIKPSKKEEVGPSLGMRKSSSLESLQTMIQELQKEQLESKGGNPFAGPRPATLKVSRSRGTNESFRAAVDKSYDAPNHSEAMETVAEEGSESGSSVHPPQADANGPTTGPINPPKKTAGTLSVASTQITCMSGTTTASSQVTAETREDEELQLFKKKDSTKKKGLFKSFFKFGSKKNKDSSHKTNVKELQDNEKIKAKKAAEIEQARIQEHYRRLLEQQRTHQELLQNQSHIHPDSFKAQSQPLHSTPATTQTNLHDENGFTLALPTYDASRKSKQQPSRNQHHVVHVERQAKPSDDKDGRSEKILYRGQLFLGSEPVRRAYSLRCSSGWKRPDMHAAHSRTNSYEICKEAMERPGSRVGIADADNKYSHYMNYREIQQHLEQYNKDVAYPVGYQRIPVNTTFQEVVERRPVLQQQRTITQPARRKAERPLSNYEVGNSSAIHSAAMYERQQRERTMQHAQIQYTSMPRNGIGSIPRSQVMGKVKQANNGNTVLIQRTHQPIYESAQVNIYGSSYQNGGGYNASNSRNALSRQVHSAAVNHRVSQQYHPSLYQRDVQNHSRPGSNV